MFLFGYIIVFFIGVAVGFFLSTSMLLSGTD